MTWSKTPDAFQEADRHDEIRAWIGLSLIPGLGPESIRRLLAAFGDPQRVYATPVAQLRQIVSADIAHHIAEGPDPIPIAHTLEWLAQPGNAIVTWADAIYPKALLEIHDPPPLLYVKGRTELLERPTIAVVGSRNATPQGLQNAEAFAQALSEAGWCVASGLALGVDGAAHRGALRGKGSTIAVLGTGLDIVYPARHRDLAHEISEKGVLVSEFPLGEPSKAANFPRRNRIISGLSRGVLVIEANLESGSLITARLAAEQGREVFAIPGSIHSPLSKGCHRLIKQGAKLVDSLQDILEELGGAPILESTSDVTDEADDSLLQLMGYDAVAIDTLVQRSGLTSEQVSSMLLSLELQGKVACLPGGRYQRLG
ncbi:MAG: DNA-processing protein DprA [Methylophilaceae bacterium]|nr:DNA-processing protein DprA [Methylophilaceae bacterium]